eukprot:6213461-Pleurochrysis_carterae.AAC.2
MSGLVLALWIQRWITYGEIGSFSRETRRLAGVPGGRLRGRRFGWRGCRTPRETRFAEVDFGRGDDAAFGRDPDVVGSGGVGAAPKVEANPSAGGVGGTGRAVQYVDRVGDSVIPECGWCSAGNHRSARKFHDASNGPLRDAVELVNVRGTSRCMHAVGREERSELCRQELAGVVAVESAYHLRSTLTTVTVK